MKNSKRLNYIKGLLASIVFTSLGVFFLRGIFLKPVSEINKTEQWIETECVIKSMKFEEIGEGPYSRPEIEVVYCYEFNDKEYKSDVYELCASFDNLKQTGGAMYSPGDKATCFVNPENPEEAVMVKPEYSNQFFWVILPIGFIIFGIVLGIIICVRGKV